MQRRITDIEIKKAKEFYLLKSKHITDRLSEAYKCLTHKAIKTDKEVRVFYEETCTSSN